VRQASLDSYDSAPIDNDSDVMLILEEVFGQCLMIPEQAGGMAGGIGI
jgi:hypothetical protein